MGHILGILLSAVSSLAAQPATIPNDTQTAANFFLTTCQGSVDNLSAVIDLARLKNWIPMLDPIIPERDAVRVNGMWQVSQNGQSYVVALGTGPRSSTACLVTFDEPKPSRDDFIAAVSNIVTLKVEADPVSPHWRSEFYQIEDLEPMRVVLQFMSNDGVVYEASVTGPQH
jgi:hypothetical protein